MRKQRFLVSHYRESRRRRFLLLLLTGLLVPAVLALIATAVFVLPKAHSRAAAAINGDCTLIVPPNPLSAQGLATPYQLLATNPANGPCNEANPAQAAFVQGAVLDPVKGTISVYNSLVIDQGTQPAVTPVAPTLPKGAVVGLWFGSNGTTLTLLDDHGSLQQGFCVNGVGGSIFGQFSYCHAPAFFQAANQAIQAGKLKVPPIGRAKDGMQCPTTRDFSIVDQDQSDNVTTTYLVNGTGQTAQDTASNAAAMQGQVQKNGSDERLLTLVDKAIGCTPWMAPDLANAGQMATALPLNELQAAADQAPAIGLVPKGDPMVLSNNHANLDKLNAYRVGVDQPTVQNVNAASTRLYCQNLLDIAPPRLLLDSRLTKQAAPPDPAAANTLFTFLAQRFVATFENNGLNCTKLLGVPDPITVKTDGNGVAVDATINGKTIFTPYNCSVNGNVMIGCTGTTTINGQSCSFKWDRNARQLNITCPAIGP